MRKIRVFVGALVVICAVTGLAVYALSGLEETSPDVGPIVARVGHETISANQFVEQYRRHLLTTGQTDTPRLRRFFLDGLINKKLFVLLARDEGLASGPEFERAKERIQRKLLIDSYTASVIYDSVSVDENDLLDMFARMNTQLKARHLYTRTSEAAQRLHERVLAGETFEALAKETFQDSTLANSGGSVGYFGFDEMDPAFEDAAFSLKPGEISAPVKTAQGYSVIQLEDRFLHPMLTETEFARRKARVRHYASYRKRIEARRVHVQQILDDLNVRVDPEVANAVWTLTLDRNLAQSENERAILGETIATYQHSGRTLAWTVATLREASIFAGEEEVQGISGPDGLTQLVEGLIVQSEMARRAEAMSLDETPEFAEVMTGALDDWIYTTYRKAFAENVHVPEDSVRAYFDRFGDEFSIPERRSVREILVETRPAAEDMLRRSRTEPFEYLAATHSTRPGAGLAGGMLGYVARSQLGVLGEPVFAAQENEVIGPFEVAGRYAVLKVGDRLESRPALFAEVRDEIQERLHSAIEQRQLRDKVSAVKNIFPVSVVDGVLYSVPLVDQAPPDPP